jgi:hypothetical protein
LLRVKTLGLLKFNQCGQEIAGGSRQFIPFALVAHVSHQGVDLGRFAVFQILEHGGSVVEGCRHKRLVKDLFVAVGIRPGGMSAEGGDHGEGLVDDLVHQLLRLRPFGQRAIVHAEDGAERIEGAVVEKLGKKRLVDVGDRQCGMTSPSYEVGEADSRVGHGAADAVAYMDGIGGNGYVDETGAKDGKAGYNPRTQSSVWAETNLDLLDIAATVLHGDNAGGALAKGGNSADGGGGVISLGGEEYIVIAFIGLLYPFKEATVVLRGDKITENAGHFQATFRNVLDKSRAQDKIYSVTVSRQHAAQGLSQSSCSEYKKIHVVTRYRMAIVKKGLLEMSFGQAKPNV